MKLGLINRRLLVVTLALAGLIACGWAFTTQRTSLIPTVKAQAQDSPFDRVRRRECTNSINGRYGYTFDGTIAGLGLTKAVGVITINGDGTLSAADTLSASGQIQRRTFTGTYNVRPDCTGTAAFSTGTAGDFVVSDDLRQIKIILSTPGVTVTGDLIKMP